MAEARRDPLAACYAAGRYGAPVGPGVSFERRQPAAMLLVTGIATPAPAAPRPRATPEPTATVIERTLAGTPVRFLGTAPGEWLAVGDELAPDALRAAVSGALGPGSWCITDLSHARARIRMSGPATPALLAKGCSIELDAIGAGGCVATLLAEIRVLIHRLGDTPRTDLYVPRSLAASMWEWLKEAAFEFGYRVVD